MNRPGSALGGGATATGGSAVIPPLTSLLAALVRGTCRGLELLLDSGHVLRVLEELLEQPPLTLSGRRAKRRRLVVGHVEDDRLRCQERRLDGLRDRIGIHARGHVVVAGAEA